jgi:hypothetical protein
MMGSADILVEEKAFYLFFNQLKHFLQIVFFARTNLCWIFVSHVLHLPLKATFDLLTHIRL